MKKGFIKYLTLLILFASVVMCSNKKQDSTGLLLSLLLNYQSDKNVSVIVLDRVDITSYTGKCMDTFKVGGDASGTSISATNYYKTVPGGSGGQFNNDLHKAAVSKSSCSDLGFTGGLPQYSEQGYFFKAYYCDPNNKPCSSTSIKAAGF